MNHFKLFTILSTSFIIYNCVGTKNYSFQNNEIKVLRSGAELSGVRPLDLSNTPEKNNSKDLMILSYDKRFNKLIPKFSKFDQKTKSKTSRTHATYQGGKFQLKRSGAMTNSSLGEFQFSRIIRPLKSKFMTLALDFKIIPNHLSKDEIAFTIDSLSFDYSKIKIKPIQPVILLCIEFISSNYDNSFSKAPYIIIPFVPGKTDLLNQLDYKKYYTAAFSKSMIRDITVRVTELSLNQIPLETYKKILKESSNNLPFALNAIASRIGS